MLLHCCKWENGAEVPVWAFLLTFISHGWRKWASAFIVCPKGFNFSNVPYRIQFSFFCKIHRWTPPPPYLIGSHGRIVFHPLFNNFHHRAQDFGIGRLLDQGREDDLDEVLPHLHAHDRQACLHQVKTQHDQLAGHCEDRMLF